LFRAWQTQLVRRRDGQLDAAMDTLQRTKSSLQSSSMEQDVDSDWMISLDEITWSSEQLGSGSFGSVFKGRFRGSDVAIKTVHASSLGLLQPSNSNSNGSTTTRGGNATDPRGAIIHHGNKETTTLSTATDSGQALRHEMRSNFEAEMRLLSKLRHPNCIMLMGAFVPSRKSPHSDVVIVTEYMKGGSLADILSQRPHVLASLKIRLSILLDCAKGLSYHLHLMMIIS
jgi:serine/threonine protein kinase